MSKTLTKADLVADLAERMDVTKKDASEALDALAEMVKKNVADGATMTLPGIGKISVRDRPARQMRNPATGETINKDADKVVKIAPLKALKDAANG